MISYPSLHRLVMAIRVGTHSYKDGSTQRVQLKKREKIFIIIPTIYKKLLGKPVTSSILNFDCKLGSVIESIN